jgi:O-antigen ligase
VSEFHKDGPPGGAAPSLALTILVALALATPWAFGSVDPLPRLILVVVALSTCSLAATWAAAAGRFRLPDVPLWPLFALLGLGVLQLVPLPAPVLRLVSAGSAEVWYPAAEAARAVLGEGPRPISLDPIATVRGLVLAAGLVGLGLLSVPALTRSGPALRAASALVLGGAALAVYGILARSRFGALIYGYIEVPTVSPFGPFVSKNHFAGYVAPLVFFTIGLCVGLAGRAREKEWTRDKVAPGVVLALVAAGAMGISLFVSRSRGGALAAAGGGFALAALLYARRGHSRALAPAAAVAVALLGLLAMTLPEEARARVTSLEGASFRLDTWRDGLRVATRSPVVGHGFGSFVDAHARGKRGHGYVRVEHAENEYVEMLVEGGLLALSFAILAFVLPMLRIRGALGRRQPLQAGLALGALAGLFALVAHSAVDFNLRLPSNATLAAILSAFASAGAGLRYLPVGRITLPACALVFAGLAGGVAIAGPQGFDRDVRWRDVREEVREAAAAGTPDARGLRIERATSRLRETLRRRPGFAEGWLLLAALRHEAGHAPEAKALAAHAISLDPSRPEIGAAARALQSP